MSQTKRIQIEVCAASIISAIAANKAGADRIELCDNLSEGGTTPSAGMIKMCSDLLDLETWVMIRPRGGDFLYNDHEFAVIKEDVLMARHLGAKGVVLGILNIDGSIDIERMNQVVQLANPMKVSFHRAFDMCKDPFMALDDLITIGVVRVLTSGMKNKAVDGIELINKLYHHAKGKIEIMLGSGINENNIKEIVRRSNIDAVHLTGRSSVNSPMVYKPDNVVLNDFGHQFDFLTKETNENIIQKVVKTCQDLN